MSPTVHIFLLFPNLKLILTISYLIVNYDRWLQNGLILLLAYIVHYLPFFGMGRVLYIHHYLPAATFALMLIPIVIEHAVLAAAVHYRLEQKMATKIHAAIAGVILALTLYYFFVLAPLTYGTDSNHVALRRQQLRGAWDLHYRK